MEMSQGLSLDTHYPAPWIIDNRKVQSIFHWNFSQRLNISNIFFFFLEDNLEKKRFNLPTEATDNIIKIFFNILNRDELSDWSYDMTELTGTNDKHWQYYFFLPPIRSSKMVSFSLAFRWFSRDISVTLISLVSNIQNVGVWVYVVWQTMYRCELTSHWLHIFDVSERVRYPIRSFFFGIMYMWIKR